MKKHRARKKKIVFLLNDMDVGGVQKSILALLKFLVSLGTYNIDLIIWQKNGVLEVEIAEGVRTMHLDYPPLFEDIKKTRDPFRKIKYAAQYLRFKWFSLRKKPWSYYKTLKKRYDIAVSFVHRGYPVGYTIDNVVANKKILWFHHGIYEGTEDQKRLDSVYFPLYDTIVAVSNSNNLEIQKFFPNLADKLKVVFNLIDVQDIIQKADDTIEALKVKDEYIFVTVSRICKEKGIDLAIETASLLKEKKLKFKWYFVGEGVLLPVMEEQILKKNLGDVCYFLGAKTNPYPYMSQADFYIQTSYVEAHPVTINEALVLKKMIVATDLKSIRSVLQDGHLGVLCEAKAGSFADAILELTRDNVKMSTLKKALEQHTVSNEVTQQKIIDLFEI